MEKRELYTYVAGPFFNTEQIERLKDVKAALEAEGVAYYSPMDECLYVPGETSPFEVLKENTDAIDRCDFITVITDGKDTGTMFEAGYAHGTGKQIVYIWLTGEPGQKFNLMLAASGSVTRTIDEYRGTLSRLSHVDSVSDSMWKDGDFDIE